MLRIPAGAAHLIAMATEPERRLTLTLGLYRDLLAQLMLGRSWALVPGTDPDAVPVALAGFCDIPGDMIDVWFLPCPGGVGRHAPAIAWHARRTIDAEAQGGKTVVAFVRPGNTQGERLARALGFEPEDFILREHRRWRFA